MDNKKSQDTIECNFVMEEAEKYFVSWTYWNTANPLLSPIFQNGIVDKQSAVFFARPYPIATAGIPIKLSFDIWKGEFKYEFHARTEENPAIAKNYPTEIFVPKLQYPRKEYIVEVSKDISWRISPSNEDIIQLFVAPTFFSKARKSSNHSFIKIRRQR